MRFLFGFCRKAGFHARPDKKCREGFTLLELLIVVAILAVLVALALPFYLDYINQAKITAAQADVKTFCKSLAEHDQLEPTLFSATAPLSLIGKYMQDYRKTLTQVYPIDPWGNDYIFLATEGAVLSLGPNGKWDSGANYRVFGGDDIGQNWKPEFFISDGQARGNTVVDLFFSRKLDSATFAPGDVTMAETGGGVPVVGTINKMSDFQFRLILTTTMTAAKTETLTLTNGSVTSMDGKAINAANTNPFANPANVFVFFNP